MVPFAFLCAMNEWLLCAGFLTPRNVEKKISPLFREPTHQRVPTISAGTNPNGCLDSWVKKRGKSIFLHRSQNELPKLSASALVKK